MGHFRTLLEGIVANPDSLISQLPLLTESERHQLVVEWNDTQTDYPQDQCIHQLIEAQVDRRPDAVAVVFEDEQLTYRELDRRANQLAHHLVALGVKPEVLVGICMERGLEMLVGLLGILKAGGAYVPLDPEYPKERIAFMLEDAQVPVLLTQQRLLGKLPELESQVICLDSGWNEVAQEREDRPEVGVGPENLAYVLYTSGSTGRPKGVAIEHHSSVGLLGWARGVYTPEDLSGVLASTSICFDLSVFELFVPLSWGGKVILAKNALNLRTLPAQEDVTLVNTVPSAMAELLREGPLPHSVRTVNLAGEPLSTQLVQQIYQQGTVQRVFDLYGPSEDTTYSTFALRSSSGPATIGRPIANKQGYILDPNLQPVPVGVSGELHIGGNGLARGYLNRPELTAEKFIVNPLREESNGRLYKTGDLARYLPDGNIQFLGRMDDQVKMRGFRIELGEVAAALEEHPHVRDAVVIMEDRSGDQRMVAYPVATQDPAPSTSELRSFLQEKLPKYMIPNAFILLDALPLTPNGKVDRKALPAVDSARLEQESSFAEPRTATEALIAEIWGKVLDVDRVGVHDNFFDLGGHSLLSMRVIGELEKKLGVRLAAVELVGETLGQLASSCDERLQLPHSSNALSSTGKLLSVVKRKVFSRTAAPGYNPGHWSRAS